MAKSHVCIFILIVLFCQMNNPNNKGISLTVIEENPFSHFHFGEAITNAFKVFLHKTTKRITVNCLSYSLIRVNL